MADREQIEKMARDMCGFCIVDKRCALKCCAPCSDVASCDCSYKENAKMLIDAGYGDVSEYKAEIKRLKADIDHQIDATNDAENLADHLKYVLYKTRKQAKIDVLNKVKNCREATDSDCYPYLERIVNKLIKEIENEQKD